MPYSVYVGKEHKCPLTFLSTVHKSTFIAATKCNYARHGPFIDLFYQVSTAAVNYGVFPFFMTNFHLIPIFNSRGIRSSSYQVMTIPIPRVTLDQAGVTSQLYPGVVTTPGYHIDDQCFALSVLY